MPSKKVAGRDRLEIRADPAWIDQVTEAARRVGCSLSSYVRIALTERMQRDGILVQPTTQPALATPSTPPAGELPESLHSANAGTTPL